VPLLKEKLTISVDMNLEIHHESPQLRTMDCGIEITKKL
jgi:hypothetical protein